MSEGREASLELLRSLAPLEGMKRNLHALSRKVTIQQMAAGRLLFKQGENDKRTVWVIGGLVELSDEGRTVGLVKGGSNEARSPSRRANPASTRPKRPKTSTIYRSTASCSTS